MDNKKNFFEDVYQVVRLIPSGRVSSYGAIAEYLGSKGSARMVGWAMNQSHGQVVYVPAHRVVNRNGLLTGKHCFGLPTRMEALLEAEGVLVVENVVKDFEVLFWNPVVELGF